jgi:hypothetical protein
MTDAIASLMFPHSAGIGNISLTITARAAKEPEREE